MRNFSRIFISFILVMLLLASQAVTAFADTDNKAYDENLYAEAVSYSAYSKANNGASREEKAIELNLEKFSTEGALADFGDGLLSWKDGEGNLNFSFETHNDGLFNLKVVWKPQTVGLDVSLGVKLDGAFPFEEAKEIVLKRLWQNKSDEPRTDAAGNEYAQEQVETEEFIEELLHDSTGIANAPYEFYLSKGVHILTLEAPEQGIILSELSFVTPEKTESYKEASDGYENLETKAASITIQAETADLKTSSSIIPKSNNSDAGMTPSNPYLLKINYIGGTTWQKPAERLTWNFNVDTAGYYCINFRYKQSDLINGQSLRWLKIDGKTPFTEAKTVTFPYGTGWERYTFSDENSNPYYFFLDEGSHTLSLEVNVGEKAEHFERLSEIVETLGDEYIKIIMITSETPDLNRDYELFKQIPGFTETLEKCYSDLEKLVSDIKVHSNNQSTQYVAAMQNMMRVLNSMLKSPYVAQQYLSDYYTNYTALGSWLYDMVNMPLSLDEISFIPYGQNTEKKDVGFFKSLLYGIKRFIISFSNNYSFSSEENSDKDNLRIWVNWGQDQASVLNSLINESFTQQTGIKVNLEIVNASLINGILSGNFPDLAIQMTRTDPVNLGIRGALYDLSNFEDCDEVLSRFQASAEVPYQYNDALYALPDTQSFLLMFYRTDIFKNLGLTPPKTWNEFLDAATVIQRNNMSVYVPYTQITSSTTVNAGIGSLNLFPTLMSQSGLSLYNEELNATNLISKASIDVFERWTEFYTDYDLYKEADFYNRFRGGSMPLGIAPYATYMTLYSAAREISGRWSVALVPGTENGNNTVAGAGTGCAIIKKSSHKDEAWEFLKWWTSADTQVRFSNNVESILGMIGRIGTSNIEAFSRLSWETDVLDVLLEQWSLVNEVPEVPGSYYLTRCIDQAYWSVVNGTAHPKDTLIKWSKVADDEIMRKINDYSID
ncbi:MAG: extracellular solute-binding protein [Clostridia bacterium]|nr:extracellular solute-binding protein [Clostridia bacterium]